MPLANQRSTICTLAWGTIHVLHASEHNGLSYNSLLCIEGWQAAAYGVLAVFQVFPWTPGPFVWQAIVMSYVIGLTRMSLEHTLLLGMMRLGRLKYVAKYGYNAE